MTTNHEQLLHLLENKRQKLIKVGIEKGLNSEDTIKLSQEVDNIINLVLKSKLNKVH